MTARRRPKRKNVRRVATHTAHPKSQRAGDTARRLEAERDRKAQERLDAALGGQA